MLRYFCFLVLAHSLCWTPASASEPAVCKGSYVIEKRKIDVVLDIGSQNQGVASGIVEVNAILFSQGEKIIGEIKNTTATIQSNGLYKLPTAMVDYTLDLPNKTFPMDAKFTMNAGTVNLKCVSKSPKKRDISSQPAQDYSEGAQSSSGAAK